ncbi:hypothetical protein EPIB2_75 [Tritonibacter mobilis]|uniref:hypothetical protein n=1 Tax=Tritonibacter mobilis TaxID=379347 RepID=UPI000F6F798D|nr:hypothetical protein [Tritonibacter mobilis]VCU60998.1 hypothetical protein EPIB2_75 [Tritonibacter mobilis]
MRDLKVCDERDGQEGERSRPFADQGKPDPKALGQAGGRAEGAAPGLRRRAQRGANPQIQGSSAAQWPAYPGMGRRIGLFVWAILGLGGDLNDEDDN